MTLNFNKELKFIHLEKTNMLDKNCLQFELLNAAQSLISDYMGAKTDREKLFYKAIYFQTKSFYLKSAKKIKN